MAFASDSVKSSESTYLTMLYPLDLPNDTNGRLDDRLQFVYAIYVILNANIQPNNPPITIIHDTLIVHVDGPWFGATGDTGVTGLIGCCGG